MAKINFMYADKQLNYPKKRQLKAAIEKLFSAEKKPIQAVNYIFCSDEYLLKINQDFLNHHYHTDIISFLLSPKSAPIEGEIYISIDRVLENAKRFEVSFEEELKRVAFHGALHFCGYKDKKKDEQAAMRQKEDEYLHATKECFT